MVNGRSAHYTRIGEESGRPTVYTFCPDCGGTILYQSETDPGIVVIPVGTFAEIPFAPPTRSYFHRARSYPWLEITAEPLERID